MAEFREVSAPGSMKVHLGVHLLTCNLKSKGFRRPLCCSIMPEAHIEDESSTGYPLEGPVLFYMHGKMRSLIWVSNVRRAKWGQDILGKELPALKRYPWWLEQAVGPSKYSHT